MRILIAEDDPSSRLLLETSLIRQGHEVVATPNGEDAWSELVKPDAPRLLIVDWMMPLLDGVSLCRRVRAKLEARRPYVIILTALTEREAVIEGLDAGADDFVFKPFDYAVLQARIAAGERILEMQTRLEEQASELRDALDQVKTLRGIIPICSHCKRIRDDEDYWREVSDYVSEHTDALFSHGICPTCLAEYYPDFKGDKDESDDESDVDFEDDVDEGEDEGE